MVKRHIKGSKESAPAFESVLAVLRDRPNAVVLDDPSGRSIVSFTESPLLGSLGDLQGEIRAEIQPHQGPANHPFPGGVMGYVSYESGRFFEKMPGPQSPLPVPEFGLRRYDGSLVHQGGEWSIAGTVEFQKNAEELLSEAKGVPALTGGLGCTMQEPPPREFLNSVERVLEHIAMGDCYQVNVARRLEFEAPESMLGAFLRLRQRYPSQFGAWLNGGQFSVLSNSPELFLRVRGDVVETAPIKGTRPIIANARDSLRDSEKEQAELTMIVDMARNDLARCCVPGSVRAESREILELPTLFHAQQRVFGMLEEGCDAIDAFAACFPPASVTGAPKVKAMELIHDLEPVPRGVYTGAIGYFSDGGEACFSVAIRTLMASKNRAWLHVGSGIVADSDPAQELAESGWKAKAFIEALTGLEMVQ